MANRLDQPAPAPANVAQLLCPRCGYDISGVVPTWTEACPLEGTCSECGLGFDWTDIFNRLRDVPPWFFELANRPTARRLVSTSVRTLAPWHFWRAIRMGFPLRPLRLAALICLGGGGVYVLGVLLAIAPWLLGALVLGAPLREITRGLMDPAMLRRWFAWPLDNEANGFFLVWLIPSLIMPLAFVLLPDTLGQARVRPVHFVRATVYTLVPIPVLCVAEHAVRTLARLAVVWDPLSLHAVYAGGPWRPPPTLLGRLVESIAWGDLFWPVLWPLWMIVMWWCVCRLYLRIRHAFWTAFILFLLSCLAAIAVPAGIGAAIGAFP